MPMRMRYTVTGDEKLARVLGRLKKPGSAPIFTRGLRRSGKLVKQTSQQRYLSGQVLKYRTGELHDSVGLTVVKPDEEIYVGSPLPQAAPLHFGWPAHNLRPHPFIVPPLDDSIPKFADIFLEEIDRQLGSAT